MEWAEIILKGLYFLLSVVIVYAYLLCEAGAFDRMQTPHKEGPQITFNWEKQGMNHFTPAVPVKPAEIVVPAAPKVSDWKGKCVICLTPATTRCAACKSAIYCSVKCQIIHWRSGHKETCQPSLRPFASAATTLRPPQPMPIQVNLDSLTHRSNTKEFGIQEGASDDQFGARNKSVSSDDAIIEEALQLLLKAVENCPQIHAESTRKSGKRNNRTNSPAELVSSNSGCKTDIATETIVHPDCSEIKEVQRHFSEKSPYREAAGYEKSPYGPAKSDYMSEKLQYNIVEKVHLLDVQKLQYVPRNKETRRKTCKETNRLEEKLAKKSTELEKLKKLQDEVLKENKILRNMQNDMAKELENLRQQIDERASMNDDEANPMEFSYLELKEATNNFDHKLKIGEGGYGCVYKGVLHSTTVAIKILHRGGHQGEREFYQEVEILRKVRHPNIVALIGGCSQIWALVYEFIPNGSLDNYLGTLEGRKLLSWKTRIQIVSNICSALIFVHSTKPHGIAHGDLKPANILLDSNYQAKLSDFGISRQLMKTSNTVTPQHLTECPKGSFPYIDPEYMQTGEMNTQCDVYSFGLILLQLVTGKTALGMFKSVQKAIQSHTLKKEIDVSAKWPSDKAMKMAKLGLRCCNPTRKNRPNLASEVWSEIESMKPDASS